MAAKWIKKYVSPERQLEFKVKALAASIEATGVPKDQALVIARQKLEKEPDVSADSVPAQASIFTSTNLVLMAVIVVGVVYFMNPGGNKRG